MVFEYRTQSYRGEEGFDTLVDLDFNQEKNIYNFPLPPRVQDSVFFKVENEPYTLVQIGDNFVVYKIQTLAQGSFGRVFKGVLLDNPKNFIERLRSGKLNINFFQELEGKDIIVKRLFRGRYRSKSLQRLLLQNELIMYKYLEGLDFIPQVYGYMVYDLDVNAQKLKLAENISEKSFFVDIIMEEGGAPLSSFYEIDRELLERYHIRERRRDNKGYFKETTADVILERTEECLEKVGCLEEIFNLNKDLLAKGRKAFLSIVERLCDIYDTFKQKGIVHLDCKPGNILVQYSSDFETGEINIEDIKIIDLGISMPQFERQGYESELEFYNRLVSSQYFLNKSRGTPWFYIT